MDYFISELRNYKARVVQRAVQSEDKVHRIQFLWAFLDEMVCNERKVFARFDHAPQS